MCVCVVLTHHTHAGTWFDWLVVMGNIAVVTNMAVVIFSTSENAFRFQWAQDNPVWTFLIAEVRVCACCLRHLNPLLALTHMPSLYAQHLVFIAKRLFDAAVADIPPDVALQLQRQEYVAPAPSTVG